MIHVCEMSRISKSREEGNTLMAVKPGGRKGLKDVLNAYRVLLEDDANVESDDGMY